MTRAFRVVAVSAVLVLAAACGGGGGGGSASPTTTSSPPAAAVWPLIGVAAEGAAERPALAVKIENSVAARPQTGLGAADLVWEEVVEGGITRFLAVYHSHLPAEAGPVRSVRPMDAAIAGPLHGLFAFSGGIPAFVDAVAAAGLQVLSNDAGAPGFHRDDARRAPHNLYADPSVLLDQADAGHSAAPPEQFAFAAPGEQPTAVATGQPASSLALTLSGSSHPAWTWSDGRWLRAEDGAPAVDSDGSRLSATNVVVLRVDLVTTAYRDAAGNPVPETQLIGSGEALVATGGRTLAATWSKASVGEPVELTGPDGAPVLLAPGSTWIELVPNGSGAVGG